MTAALALIASKSSAIRYNSQKVGKKWMYILALPTMRLGKAGKPCLGAQGLLTLVSAPVVPCLTLPMGPTRSCLVPGCEGMAACRERGSGNPTPGGDPTILPCWHCPYCSHSQILIPGLAPCPPDLGGPHAAPLGRVSRHTRDDVNSVQPCFYTALLGKPSDHIAELQARPARLPAPWARAPIASAPKQWVVAGALS